PVPVETIPAIADADLIGFGPIARLAPPDAEQTEQDAFIRHRIQVIKLRLDPEIRTPMIESVRSHPGYRVARLPVRSGDGVRPLAVVARSAPAIGTDTVDPQLSERVVEHGGAVPARSASSDRLAPVNSIGRDMHGQSPAVGVSVRSEHFVT